MSSEKMTQAASPRLDRSGIARIFQIVVFLLIIGGLLFGSTGRWDWWEGWAFLSLFVLFLWWGRSGYYTTTLSWLMSAAS